MVASWTVPALEEKPWPESQRVQDRGDVVRHAKQALSDVVYHARHVGSPRDVLEAIVQDTIWDLMARGVDHWQFKQPLDTAAPAKEWVRRGCHLDAIEDMPRPGGAPW